jgi:uncharacterized membrane protein YccC
MFTQSPQDLERETAKPKAADPGIVSLLGEIVTDFQHLVKQHLDLFKHEVREDVRKSKQAVGALVTAYMLTWLGAMLFCAAAVGLLAWAVPGLPWWGWAGIVGVAVCGMGAAMGASAKRMFASITPLPDQTAKAIKEDIQWLKK